MKTGITLIAEERERQQLVEGWGPYHDDQHKSGELVDAAEAYVHAASEQARGQSLEYLKTFVDAAVIRWPWEDKWWKPSDDPVRNLVKAGALIAAEIDRLQRQNDQGQTSGNCEANARLIAAAPKMLEALRGVMIARGGHMSDDGCGCADCEYLRPVEEAIRAALGQND